MTIAAGFLCSDGVMICADTEITGGVKYNAQKVRRFQFRVGEYVITGTGNTSYLGMANDMIEAALYREREAFEVAEVEGRIHLFREMVTSVIREIHASISGYPYD